MIRPFKKSLKKSRAELLFQLVISFGIICSFASLAMVDDLRLDIPFLIFITALVVVLVLAALYFSEADPVKPYSLIKSPVFILFTALIIRFVFVFQPALLSDDIFRYYIDGSQLVTGQNPYSKAPETYVGQEHIDQSILSKVNHPDLVTIYPPAAQWVFGAGAVFNSVSGMKVFFTFIDLITCALLIILLKRMKLPVSRSILYAWHPLPVVEISSSGHVDGVALFFILAGFLFLYKQPVWGQTTPVTRFFNTALSGFLFSCAFLIKLFPIVFLPAAFLFSRGKGRYYFTAGFLTGIVILSVPFLPDITNAFDTLRLYTQTWEFSGFLFRQLRHITDSGNMSRIILASGFGGLVLYLSLREELPGKSYDKPVFRETLKTCYFISMAYLLLTPTLHPWYALYMVGFLPFFPGPAGLTLSWAVFLGYYIQIPYTILGIWEENNLVPGLIFSAPLLTIILCRITKKRGLLKNKGDSNSISGSV